MRTGILLDENGDLAIENGDFAVGETTEQEINLLLKSNKGDWRQHPTAGMGIARYLRKRAGNSVVIDTLPRFVREIKVELQADGMKNPEIVATNDLSEFKITVDQ